jgi:hypothetical protein
MHRYKAGKRKALGYDNTNTSSAPYPSMTKYASIKDLDKLQQQLDAQILRLKEEVADKMGEVTHNEACDSNPTE